jgi:hypothetical protein
MTHTKEIFNYEVMGLLHRIQSYEPNIYNYIMTLVFYKMKNSNELREAVKLWIISIYKLIINKSIYSSRS